MTRVAPLSVWAYALILALLTSLPYALHALNAPDGWVYSGAAVVPDGVRMDYTVYVAVMWQGAAGDWATTMPFTHEAHVGIPLVHTTYVALGALANVLPLDFIATYHLARFLLTIGVVLALWRFIAHVFSDNVGRWLALLFATLTSGWSWLLLFIAPHLTSDVSPIEFWLQDAFNLFGTLYTPHFALVIMLQVVIVLSALIWLAHGRRSALFWLTFALGYAAGVQPYAAPFWFALLGALTGYRVLIKQDVGLRRALWLALPLSVHGLLVLYVYITMNNDPIWANFLAQTATVSPPISHYITGYLPYLLPLLIALPALLRDDRWLLPLLWVVLVALLLYAPLPSQRRYLLGVQTPLAVLAAFGWLRLVNLREVYRHKAEADKTRREIIVNTLKIGMTALYIALAAAGTVGMWSANLLAALNPTANTDVYISQGSAAAYTWLRDNSAPDAIILTVFDLESTYSGGWLGMMTGRRAYLGHWAFSAYADEKLDLLRRFYDAATSDTWRQNFLTDVGAAYIWYDAAAQALGDWQPEAVNWLTPVLTTDAGTLFLVRLSSPDD